MPKLKLLFLFVVLTSFYSYAQDFTGLWEGYFSYYEIKDVSQGDGKIFAASENAIFSYDINTFEIETISTVDGLSGETISTIRYSEAFDLLVIGYNNGLIEIVFTADEEVLSVVDIVEKATIAPNLKRINHFYEYEGLLYISTDYGISIYDLERLEFGDSYFIGFGGSQIAVNQTTIYNNTIYAACGNNEAIKTGNLDNPNLIDSDQWQSIGSGNYHLIEAIADRLYVVNSNNTLFEVINNSLQQRLSYTTEVQDLRAIGDQLLLTTDNQVYAYQPNLTNLFSIGIYPDFETTYVAATLTDPYVYIGTRDLGLLKVNYKSPSEIEAIRPEGPLQNYGFKIEASYGEIYMTYGDYTVSYNPAPLREFGLSHYKDETWRNVPYDSLLGARNLNYISINPFKTSQVYVSSFQDGMLEINEDIATVLYNEGNSGLESLSLPNDPNFKSIRISGTTFDRSGMLWVLNSRVESPLKSYDPSTAQWRSYSFSEIIEDPLNDELGFQELDIDGNNTKWIASFNSGVIGFNENNGNLAIKNIFSEEDGLETTNIKAVAVDNRNQLWIGTIRGLRVLFNTANFFEDPDPKAQQIIFDDEGIAKELLAGQFITDIKVDGSNNKWISTLDSGVFYFTPDGQETIYHFTTSNSPLPSNIVNDISIDFQSGKVFFATDRGLVSFLSGGSEPNEDLEEAFVYPNPVRPEYNILGFDNLNDINNGVKVKGLTENVNIKITDIEGNLVAEAQSRVNQRSSGFNYNFAIDGGTAIWNGKNLANNIVASGVYLFMISDLDSFETKVLKLVIIR